MIEIAIDRKHPRTDQLVSIAIDHPGRSDLGEAFDLLGNPVVQRFFLGAELGIRQPGDPVNLEVDVLAKYVERLLTSQFSNKE